MKKTAHAVKEGYLCMYLSLQQTHYFERLEIHTLAGDQKESVGTNTVLRSNS
jgi:hypothetical protein